MVFVLYFLLCFPSVSSFIITNNNNNVNSYRRGCPMMNKGNQILIVKSTIDDNSCLPQASTSSNEATVFDNQCKFDTSDYNDDDDDGEGDDEYDGSGSAYNFQLWLDLRQTSLSPQAALLHITNDLWDEYLPPPGKAFLVDKVLVGNIAVGETQRKQIVNDIIEEYEHEIQVLFQDTDNTISSFDSGDGGIKDNQKEKKNNFVLGKVFSIYDHNTRKVDVYSNPLPALEVTSSGQWLVLDSNGIEDKNERTEAVQSLLQLCQGTFMTNGDNVNESKGGIVIDCSSTSDIIEAGAFIQALVGSGKGYATTESGILINQSEENSPQNRTEQITNYALLIPFDALLWKTASFVVGGHPTDSI